MIEFKNRKEEIGGQPENKEKREEQRIGRITLLRHGQTKYTDQYPDLTELGQETIAKTAEQIALGIKSKEGLRILSSPTVRAQGTAGIIKEKIGHMDEIKVQPSLGMNRIKDKEKAQAIFDEIEAEGNKAEHEAGAV